MANGNYRYGQQSINLAAPKKYKLRKYKKLGAKTWIISFIIILVSAIPAAIYINWRFYFQSTITADGVPNYSKEMSSSIESGPIQIRLDGYRESGEYKGRKLDITFKDYYDITGIVVSVHDYWGFNAYDALVPRDVCVIWGNLANNYPSPGLEFSQADRYCKPKIDGVELSDEETFTTRSKMGVKMTGISTFSNNHLISSTPEIRGQIFGLSAGDKVRIVGYLVRVSYDGIVLDSSETREDAGDHAREVVYVTNIEKLGNI